ncbi:acyl-coenzyme A thioesterase 13-like [Zingiber officinale]|uniref:acyl-coenzyme A thioesterase 13-like n=1 Tax=Zingiber officinale TaxID=94328 RepID=UPI001C4D4450|nr:acyl-coenzyme A thioesterase 13-like [Zingiber officinale]
MGDYEGSEAAAVDAARRWLEGMSNKNPVASASLWAGGHFDIVCHSGLRILHLHGGRAVCRFRVPAHLTDADMNWQPGAIAAVIDNVGAAAIMTTEGIIKISVEFDISYFSAAKVDEEVEIDARIVQHKGKKLTAVIVEVRKKEGGHLVAVGRQWMSAARPAGAGLIPGHSSRL